MIKIDLKHMHLKGKRPAFRHYKVPSWGCLNEIEEYAMWSLVIEDAKWLASEWCMFALGKDKHMYGFNGNMQHLFRKFLMFIPETLLEGAPFEQFFSLRAGPGRRYYPNPNMIIYKNKRQETKFCRCYMHYLWERTLDNIKLYRQHGVYNHIHLEIYQAIAEWGFPVIHNLPPKQKADGRLATPEECDEEHDE